MSADSLPDSVVPRFVAPRATGTSIVNVGHAERIASAVGGGLLAAFGFSRGTWGGALLGAAGVGLVARGVSGYCPAFGLAGINTAEPLGDTPPAVEIAETITVAASPEETYAFWRRLENLPRFMQHLKSVTEMGGGTSLWTARSPGPLPDLTWEAEIVEEDPGRLLVWRSLENADVDNAGHVQFKATPDGGTEVHVRIAYRAPAGDLGHWVARRLDAVFSQMVKEDVRRFKHVLETGEVPTIEGQPRAE